VFVAESDAGFVNVGDGFAEADFDAEFFERTLGVVREVVGEGSENARRGFDEDDARAFRIDAAIVAGERLLRELSDGAGGFNAGRAAADDDEGGERARSAASGSSSARSKASRMRLRCSVASSRVLRPGANSSQRRGRNRRGARRWR
jgi:hypothetical protein